MWMLVAALLAALAAAALAVRWMQTQGGDRDRIAVASVDIALGSRLTPEMVRLTDWPRDSVPTGAFSQSGTLDGRVVTAALQRGEPLTEARLAPVGARAGLSAVVPPGKRAMTVRVNDVVGVAGFALPGTYVDVLVNTQHEGGRRGDSDRAISKIVLERILVLAVAQEADRDASRPKVVNAVTLELTPEQAERLDLARSVGTLSLVLRNQTDPQATVTDGATKAALLGVVATRSPAASTGVTVRRTSTRPVAGVKALSPQALPAQAMPEPAVAPLAVAIEAAPAAFLKAPEPEPVATPAVVTPDLPSPLAAAPPVLRGAVGGDALVPVEPGPRFPQGADPVPGVESPAAKEASAPAPRTCVEIVAGAVRRSECF
jgi:pilus assembly protein CpaB